MAFIYDLARNEILVSHYLDPCEWWWIWGLGANTSTYPYSKLKVHISHQVVKSYSKD